MLKRPLRAFCVLVASDLLLLAALSYFVGWRLPLGASAVTVLIGLGVITFYQSRWLNAISAAVNDFYSNAVLNRNCLEDLLLLVAGILLLIPGVLSDAAGLLLLVPWVRRRVVRGMWPHD